MSTGTRLPGATRLPWQPCERCGTLGVDAHRDESIVTLVCPRCGETASRAASWVRARL